MSASVSSASKISSCSPRAAAAPHPCRRRCHRAAQPPIRQRYLKCWRCRRCRDCSDSKKRRSLHIGGENALCGIKGIKLRFFLQIECIMAAGRADCIGKPELLGHRNAGVGERRISRCTAEGVPGAPCRDIDICGDSVCVCKRSAVMVRFPEICKLRGCVGKRIKVGLARSVIADCAVADDELAES